MENKPGAQSELFDVAELVGYGELRPREREFVKALFDGCSQREAARRAGFRGSDEVMDAAASRAVRNVKVQNLMRKAWARSGADIHTSLRQAAEISARAFNEWQQGETAERRTAARKEWLSAVTFIAAVHGKLKINAGGHFTFSIVSDDDRAHLRELAAAGVPLTMPETAGGRN